MVCEEKAAEASKRTYYLQLTKEEKKDEDSYWLILWQVSPISSAVSFPSPEPLFSSWENSCRLKASAATCCSHMDTVMKGAKEHWERRKSSRSPPAFTTCRKSMCIYDANRGCMNFFFLYLLWRRTCRLLFFFFAVTNLQTSHLFVFQVPGYMLMRRLFTYSSNHGMLENRHITWFCCLKSLLLICEGGGLKAFSSDIILRWAKKPTLPPTRTHQSYSDAPPSGYRQLTFSCRALSLCEDVSKRP